MTRLLYINNYNCTTEQRDDTPVWHLWGADRLSELYDVTCAKVPKLAWIGNRKLNQVVKNLVLALRYWSFPIVYSACSELTEGFALMKILHLWHGDLFKIQHHASYTLYMPSAYERVIYISPAIRDMQRPRNATTVNWGGENCTCENLHEPPCYQFASAGKSSRDYACMIAAAERINGRCVIVADVNNLSYDSNKIEVIAHGTVHRNSLTHKETCRIYAQSRFLVIPCSNFSGKAAKRLAGLTSFVDATVVGKPVLISDNTNMGIDVEALGIGLTYKGGDVDDMADKMRRLESMGEQEYQAMCSNMRSYAKTHNYNTFCSQLINIISKRE